MNDTKLIIRLLTNIIVSPISTLRDLKLIEYNIKFIKFVYVFLSLLTGLIMGYFIPLIRESPNRYFICFILIPIFIYIGMKAQVLIYYVLAKLIGKSSIKYVQLEYFLLPILTDFLILNNILMIFFTKINMLKVLTVIITNIWLNLIIFLLFYMNLNYNKTRAAVICIIPLIISLLFYL